jgi:sialate O-acetylesterase
LAASSAVAEVRLAAVFGDHMVLQRGRPLPIWGWAEPGEAVRVALGGRHRETTADAAGRWQVILPPASAGGPISLTVRGTNRIECTDVLVGEVWLASGQSNMRLPVRSAMNAAAEVAAADHPQLRLFTVQRRIALSPQADVKGSWEVCTPQTVAGFSAVAYFFGRQLQEALGVPVGLVHASWGGSPLEAWADRRSLAEAAVESRQLAAVDSAREQLAEVLGRQDPTRTAVVTALADSSPAAPGFIDSSWDTMEVRGNWRVPDFDGVVWFRRQVALPAVWDGRDLELRLGPVDGIDETYFDGVRVGGMGAFTLDAVGYGDRPRRYRVPGRLVQAGAHTLAVRVVDTGDAGGLWGVPADAMQLALADSGGPATAPVAVGGAWRYRPGVRLLPATSPVGPHRPTVLFNAMISPLAPLARRGVIWYQGEANVPQGLAYETRMRLLINGWRRLWGGDAFPFYYVQLAPYRHPRGDPARQAAVWEAQRRVLSLPRTGMVVTTDIGDLGRIHPPDKQEVGRRLALWALARTYGQRGLVCSGPLVKRVTREPGGLRVHFSSVGSGLASRGGGDLNWFEVAAADGVFQPACARLDGNTVLLSSAAVARPVQARFGWSEEAQPNLINREGLPASPFWMQARPRSAPGRGTRPWTTR